MDAFHSGGVVAPFGVVKYEPGRGTFLTQPWNDWMTMCFPCQLPMLSPRPVERSFYKCCWHWPCVSQNTLLC